MKDLKVLVIDEVSMLSPALFRSIDQILRTFKFNHEPFGGIQVILVGDFFQLPPVSTSGSDERFVFQTDLWNDLDLATCYLSSSYRHEDETLLGILNEIRQGEVSEASMEHFRGRYKKEPELPIDLGSLTHLYTHNRDVDEVNQRALADLDAPIKVFEAHTTGAKKWVERIFASSLVLPRLELKEGALVFFIKNNYDKGYINGTLGTVKGFDTFNAPIITTADGRELKAEREEWIFEDDDGRAKAMIKQVPLRLAWAITVHKSQGMTLDAAEIDLSQAFEPGQGYVALSRIKSLSGLKLMGLNQQALQVDPSVLEADQAMRAASDSLHKELSSIPDEHLTEAADQHLAKVGGSAKGTSNPGPARKKAFLESKPYFEQGMTVAEVAKERELKEATIWGHLYDILSDDPEFDITHLQPDANIIKQVETAAKKIKQNNNPETFAQDGSVKLKPIFEELGEQIDYDQIKYALLFLE